MTLRLHSSQLLPAALLSSFVVAQGPQGQDPYAPVYTNCPSNLTVRSASQGLSEQEQSWRNSRSERVIASLEPYLFNANIDGLDAQNYVRRLNASTAPVVGLSISGGGTQSGLGGLGIWQAFDDRYPPAVQAGTGGLTQLLYYVTGLSGGGAVTVSLLTANNFSSVEEIRRTANFSIPYDIGPAGNSTEYFNNIFENVGAKAEEGFPVSVVDAFGQFWGQWLPQSAMFMNWSDTAQRGTAFESGRAPMPIVVISEVVPGQSPEIGGIMYPGRNDTNGFNLTLYEITPYEMGNWAGGRVQAFMPTAWIGTAMNNGTVQNRSQCVQGFDQINFIQGTTANAFPAYLIDAFYNIPVFARRDLEAQQDSGDIHVPSDQENNPFVELVSQTAEAFNQTLNATLWGTYPNPFRNYNAEMRGVDELLLIDGSLAGETNPIRPLIVPERAVDFLIVYEASSDSPYSWINGTNLINTAQSASQGNVPFPEIPDVQTMVSQGLNRQPTFFGCNASDMPLVLYLPNAPWTSYSNYSFTKSSFTNVQVEDTLTNAFEIATYGNGTIDPEWPACLACAVVSASMARLSMQLPDQCGRCFSRHCWNGTTSDTQVTAEDFNLRPRLNENLTYDVWNTTIWNNASAQVGIGPGSASSGGNSTSGGLTGNGAPGNNTPAAPAGSSSGIFSSPDATLLLTILALVAGCFSLL